MQYNDIFYLKDIETDNFQRITYDGELDQMYNGIPDWVYEGNFWLSISVSLSVYRGSYMSDNLIRNLLNELLALIYMIRSVRFCLSYDILNRFCWLQSLFIKKKNALLSLTLS